MKGGFVLYKCRRCGEIVKNVHTPDGMVTIASLICDTKLPKEWGGLVSQLDAHNCKDGNFGICDVIGYEYD